MSEPLSIEFGAMKVGLILSNPCWVMPLAIGGSNWTFTMWLHPSGVLAAPKFRYLTECCEFPVKAERPNSQLICSKCKEPFRSQWGAFTFKAIGYDQCRTKNRKPTTPEPVIEFSEGSEEKLGTFFVEKYSTNEYTGLVERDRLIAEFRDAMGEYILDREQPWWAK